ncbi:MAG TPA: hypothetical protein VD867_10520 [Burkholderiales bacterium]|nr:hypothetical protein [Burkholderiales bacterium]
MALPATELREITCYAMTIKGRYSSVTGRTSRPHAERVDPGVVR